MAGEAMDTESAGITTARPLLAMTQTTPTRLWNDSATPAELKESIGWGAVGATCNPVIALAALQADLVHWGPRIADYAAAQPTASESTIGWRMVRELSAVSAPGADFHAVQRPQRAAVDPDQSTAVPR